MDDKETLNSHNKVEIHRMNSSASTTSLPISIYTEAHSSDSTTNLPLSLHTEIHEESDFGLPLVPNYSPPTPASSIPDLQAASRPITPPSHIACLNRGTSPFHHETHSLSSTSTTDISNDTETDFESAANLETDDSGRSRSTSLSSSTISSIRAIENPTTYLLTPNSGIPGESDRVCWICLSSNLLSELDSHAEIPLKNYQPWIYPCKCRGTQMWVHQACLRRWIDLKQQGDLNIKVKCPQCQYTYCINKFRPNIIVSCGKRLNDLNQSISLLSLAAMAVAGSCVVTAGIGSCIAIRVCGEQHVQNLVRKYPFRSFCGLAAIAPVLIYTRHLAQWEAPVMKALVRVTDSTTEEANNSRTRIDRTLAPAFNNSKMRLVFGAFMTPFVGCWLGEKIFKNTEFSYPVGSILDRLGRCLAGSGIFLTVKSIFKTWYLYCQNEMHKKSRICNYRKRNKVEQRTRFVGRFQINNF